MTNCSEPETVSFIYSVRRTTLTIASLAHVEVPASLLAPANAPGEFDPNASSSTTPVPASALTKEKKKKYLLSAGADPLFSELRDLNFASVGKKLNLVARRLDEDFKARHKDMTVAQLREFVGKLGGLKTEHQSLRIRELVLVHLRKESSMIMRITVRHWSF